MASPTHSVRRLESQAEMETFFALAAATFCPEAPAGRAAADWLRFVTQRPGFRPDGIRGVVTRETVLGGYLLQECTLRFGPARVRTGCIGAVVTHPAHRGQGVGRAMMRDALAHARARGEALLLLNGLAGFYDPFGFTDIADVARHAVSLAAIQALPRGSGEVRPAAAGDAAAMLRLYGAHYGRRLGGFVRSRAAQTFAIGFARSLEPGAYRLLDGGLDVGPVVALRGERVVGYLSPSWGPFRPFGPEAAADDWPAAQALLRYHGCLLRKASPGAQSVEWPLPPDSPTVYALTDHLPVRSTSHSHPHAGWMAAAVDVAALVRSLLPYWRARWEGCRYPWPGPLTFLVGGYAWTLDLVGGELRLRRRRTEPAAHRISLTPQSFVQLAFGYRPARWVARQSGQRIPSRALTTLAALFDAPAAWIAPSNGC